MSTRAAAERCDVPRATWADWESGRTSPSAKRLDEVLCLLDFDLRLVGRLVEVPGEDAVRRHLRRSLTARAGAALGDQLVAAVAAGRQGPRLLTGPAAVGVWVPHVVARGPLPLPPAPATPGLVRVCLVAGDGRQPQSTVVVPTPAMLETSGAAERWPQLRTSGRLLAEAARDAQGRRLPAHRDPDEQRELRDLAQTLTWGGRGRMPVSVDDSRAWRLDGPATLDEALWRQGLPPRNASRRGGARR